MQALPMPAATRICGRLARQLRRLRPWYGRQWAAQPLPIVVANARVVAEPYARAGARRMASLNRLEIHTAWSVCTAVCKVLCKDAHQIRAAVGAPAGARVVRTAAVCLDAELGDGRCPDGGLLCDDVAAMLCTAAGHGWSLSASCCTRAWARARRLVAAEVMELWRRSGDGLALGTHAPLATERRTLYSGLSVGREEAQRIVSGISPASRLRGNFASCRPKSTAAIQRPPSHHFNVVLIQEESGP